MRYEPIFQSKNVDPEARARALDLPLCQVCGKCLAGFSLEQSGDTVPVCRACLLDELGE